MIGKVLTKVFGSKNDRTLKKIQPLVDKINSLEAEIVKLSDTDLKEKPLNSKNASPKGNLWMIFCRRHLLLHGREVGGLSI